MITFSEERAHSEAERDDGQRVRDQEEEQHRRIGVTHDRTVVGFHVQNSIVGEDGHLYLVREYQRHHTHYTQHDEEVFREPTQHLHSSSYAQQPQRILE